MWYTHTTAAPFLQSSGSPPTPCVYYAHGRGFNRLKLVETPPTPTFPPRQSKGCRDSGGTRSRVALLFVLPHKKHSSPPGEQKRGGAPGTRHGLPGERAERDVDPPQKAGGMSKGGERVQSPFRCSTSTGQEFYTAPHTRRPLPPSSPTHTPPGGSAARGERRTGGQRMRPSLREDGLIPGPQLALPQVPRRRADRRRAASRGPCPPSEPERHRPTRAC